MTSSAVTSPQLHHARKVWSWLLFRFASQNNSKKIGQCPYSDSQMNFYNTRSSIDYGMYPVHYTQCVTTKHKTPFLNILKTLREIHQHQYCLRFQSWWMPNHQLVHQPNNWLLTVMFHRCNVFTWHRHLFFIALQWRHNKHDSVSNHQPHDCLMNRLFGRRSKKTSKLRVTGLCAGNSPGTGEFPAQITRKMFPFDDVIMWKFNHCGAGEGTWKKQNFLQIVRTDTFSWNEHLFVGTDNYSFA